MSGIVAQQMMDPELLLAIFSQHRFPYQLHHHEPAFTAEQGKYLHGHIAGAHSKNLFLKGKNNSYLLVSLMDHKRLDLKAFSALFPFGRFSFGNEQEMREKLGLRPGHVTPYGLMHDKEKKVHFILDEEFLSYKEINFHPLRNDMTITVSPQTFLKFFEVIQHPPRIMQLPLLK